MSQFKDDVVAAETVYFWFAANLTTGAADDGATPLYDVRLAGAAAGAAPTASGTPTLLTHADYTPGLHEIAIDTTGYANGEYAVFCTLTISSVNPAGFVGSFRVRTANRIDAIKTKTDYLPSATAGGAGGVFISGTNSSLTITGALTVSNGIDISASTADRAGVAIAGNGTAPGLYVAGGSSGDGIRATSGASGSGKVGLSLIGLGTAGIGIKTIGADSGAGLDITAGATGHGITVAGGATSGHGINVDATTSGDGLHLEGAGNGNGLLAAGAGTGNGIYGASGTGSVASGILAVSNATVGGGAGIYAIGVGSAASPGILAAGNGAAGIRAIGGTNQPGMALVGDGTGHGLDAQSGAGATGDGISAVANSAGGVGINVIGAPAGASVSADIAAIQADLDASATLADIVDGVLDEPTSGHATAGTVGKAVADAATAPGLVTTLTTKTLKYAQLTLRKDAAIATDNATEVGEINADGGTGAGAFANTTDSQEAIADGAGGTPPTAAAIADAVWDEAATGHTDAGKAGAQLWTQIDAVKAETASIQTDTNDLQTQVGVAGAGLTNINLPNQTMDIVGNITGNLSGSVGSVTGAVGSVTGAVGSVTGLTAADVGAIKAKTDSLTFTKALEVDANIQSINGTAVNGDGGTTPWGP